MKNLKNTLSIAVIMLMLMPVLEGCKKYEEGPLMSFASKRSRVAGKWKIAERTVGGSSALDSYYSSLTVEFTKDGFYQETSSKGVEFEGVWIFSKKKTKIGIKYAGESDYEFFRIVKLKKKEFWLKGEDGNDELEIKYEPA